MHDLGRGVPLTPSSGPTFSVAQDERQTSAFVKALQSISQRRCIERSPVSPRVARRATKLSHSSLDAPQGMYRPLRAWSICNLARVETGRVSHDARFSNALGRLSHFRSLRVTMIRTVSKKPRSQDHDQDPMRRARARANGHAPPSSPKRVWVLEAPGDAPPLPPSGWAQAANGSTVTKPGPRLFRASRGSRLTPPAALVASIHNSPTLGISPRRSR